MVWKAVGNSSLRIAALDQEWNGKKAREHIFCWAGWDKTSPSNRTWKAFFVFDKDHPNLKTAYRLPFTDVINGELVAVPQAIDAIARALASQHNELGLSEEVLKEVRQKINLYYRKMKAVPPWILEDEQTALDTSEAAFPVDHLVMQESQNN